MEAIVLIALVLVIVVKAATMHRMSHLESSIRTTQTDEAEVIERLHNMESVVRQLEQDHKTHEQEIKHLKNDKDLISLEVTKLGGKPITEAQLDALLAPPPQKPHPPQLRKHLRRKKMLRRRSLISKLPSKGQTLKTVQKNPAFWLLMTIRN